VSFPPPVVTSISWAVGPGSVSSVALTSRS
jgi:hypothetical protein